MIIKQWTRSIRLLQWRHVGNMKSTHRFGVAMYDNSKNAIWILNRLWISGIHSIMKYNEGVKSRIWNRFAMIPTRFANKVRGWFMEKAFEFYWPRLHRSKNMLLLDWEIIVRKIFVLCTWTLFYQEQWGSKVACLCKSGHCILATRCCWNILMYVTLRIKHIVLFPYNMFTQKLTLSSDDVRS